MHEGARITKSPLIVPQKQIEGLKIICESEAEDILYVPEEVQKFKEGQMVRVIDGKFKGLTGKSGTVSGAAARCHHRRRRLYHGYWLIYLQPSWKIL